MVIANTESNRKSSTVYVITQNTESRNFQEFKTHIYLTPIKVTTIKKKQKQNDKYW